ncbi:MAG: AAA family ATPase, partial [Thermomicrobiales bacterium]
MKDSLIPQAMKDAPRWGAWRTEERGGKPTKVPISAVSGRRAASNNLNDWTTFDAAVAYLKAHPDLNGRGFCLGDGWAGVDLDGCRDKTTGDIQQQAWKIINYLNSYTEVSPSGTGVKVFVRGNLPAAKGLKVEEIFGTGDHTGIEMYDSGRYFAVTGQWLEGTPQTVEKRTSKLAKLHTEFEQRRLDDTIIKKARNAKNADKFSRLFVDGDTSEHGDDDSSADLALCSLLAFYTRDRDQLDRLFRRSALYREKWEREDYRQRTIDKALTRGNDLVFEDAGGDDDNTDDDAQPIEVGDTAEPAALTWAIDDVEPDDHLTGYYSEEGAAKSLLASYRAFCYASGVQYLGHAVKKRGNVLYLDWEKGQADFERNIWAIARG